MTTTLELFLLRHGDAVADASDDAARALSARGRTEVAAAMARSGRDLRDLELVMVSPLLRARQTWDVARGLQASSAEVRISDLLLPQGDLQALMDHLQALQQREFLRSVLLVGHQPLLGNFLDRLCHLQPGAQHLATASLAAVDLSVVAAGQGELRWLRHAARA